MKYLTDEGFSVSMGGSEAYRNGWDNIFMKDSKQKTKEEVHPDGAYLTLDGTINLREYEGGKELSCEPIDGAVVLKLILSALERGLELLKAEAGAPGAVVKKPVRKVRSVRK
jgi:hypothetical protein